MEPAGADQTRLQLIVVVDLMFALVVGLAATLELALELQYVADFC